MKLVIKDDKIIAMHDDNQEVAKIYPDCIIAKRDVVYRDENGNPMLPVLTYADYRSTAYDLEGCSLKEIELARIEKEFDNNSSAYDAIIAKRIEIKLRYPKP